MSSASGVLFYTGVYNLQESTLKVAKRLGFNKPKTFQYRMNTGYRQLHGGLDQKPGRSHESLSKDTEKNYIGLYSRLEWPSILYGQRVQQTAICLN